MKRNELVEALRHCTELEECEGCPRNNGEQHASLYAIGCSHNLLEDVYEYMKEEAANEVQEKQ